MSGFANPRKNFRFALELDGINMFLIQEVQAPVMEYAVKTHGAPVNMPDAKTQGKLKVGEMVVKKLMSATGPDLWASDWFGAGVAGLSKDFRKTGWLKHLDNSGLITIQKWFLGDIWPSKIEYANLVAGGDGENMIETVTFQVQFFYPNESAPLLALFAGSAAQAGGIVTALGISE